MEGSGGSSWAPANPAPLGLAAFAMTTFVLSMVNSNLVGATSTGGAVALAFAYGGLAQLLAGMWEFRSGNTFGALAFSSYGAFWIAFFLIASGDAGALSSHGLGLFLWAWAIFTAYMTIGAIKVSGAVLLVFVLLTVTFVLLALSHDGGGSTSLAHAGGFVGIATAIAAWYASAGGVINSTFGKEVLPLFPAKK
jgi:succinate-acetate transporter protein